MKSEDINLRDPFVLVSGGKYYLYGTRGETCWGPADGFDVYVSEDRREWEGPFPCFQNDGTFWADRNYWAPEVHPWRGGFYMFASFKAEGVCWGTAILRADSPLGPFAPHSDGPVTPRDWECLDGTFYADKKGNPWIVFCHEWVQAGDGEMWAAPLSGDLKRTEGEKRLLFRASDAPWCKRARHSSGVEGYVTDGPFLWRTGDGALLCLWAGLSEQGYTQAVAASASGEIEGPFVQEPPLFERDGGHGMVFRATDGRLYLTLHSTNTHLLERPCFFPVAEKGGRLVRMEEPV